MPDAQPVASSATDTLPIAETASDLAVGSRDQAAFREARRAERSGKPLDVVAESSPAAPDDQAASTDALATAASEPAKPKEVNNADTRVQELLAERKVLRAELDALKRPARPADAMPAASSPATAAEDFPEFDVWLAKPENEGKSYAQWQRALIRYEYDQASAESSRKAAQTTAEREQGERIAQYQKAAETFVSEHDDYWTVIAPITSTPKSERTEALGDVIQRSPNAPALLYKLGAEPEAWQRLLTIPERLAVYELGKIDAALSAPAPPKTQPLTRASEPPTTLGRKASDPSDHEAAAVASRDQSRFKEIQQRNRLAAVR